MVAVGNRCDTLWSMNRGVQSQYLVEPSRMGTSGLLVKEARSRTLLDDQAVIKSWRLSGRCSHRLTYQAHQ
jgi:hypothetical protein